MINPVGFQPPIFPTGTQTPASKAEEFQLDLAASPTEPETKAVFKPQTFQERMKSPEWNDWVAEVRTQNAPIEARAQAIQDQFNAWIDSIKASAAAHNDQPHAQVTKNGEVVATFYNSGAMSGTGISPDHPEGLTGPALAQWRAELFVKTWGGEIVASNTAQSQAAWQNAQASFEKPMSFDAWLAAAGLSLHAPSRSVVDFRA